MSKQRRTVTDEEREERRAAQQQLVADSIEQLRSSEGWKRWLTTRKTFHTYSFGNVLLIALQRPTATHVAGFRAWLKLGRCVRKGEHGIRIWAPCPPTRKQLEAWRAAGADPDAKPRMRFRLTAVFAQDQVDALPPPAVPAPLEPPVAELVGDSHADLYAPLVTLADEIGFTVTTGDTGRADGYCQPGKHTIVIAARLEPNARVATLIHEIGHALLSTEDGTTFSYAEEELVVESIAFCVCQTAGLDTAGNSIPYLASWAEKVSTDVLEQTAKLIDRLARRIEDQLLVDAEPEPDGDPAAGAAAPATTERDDTPAAMAIAA